jgi:competence protein ComEC
MLPVPGSQAAIMFGIALAFCAGAAALHALPALWPPAAAMAIAAAAASLLRGAPALAAGFAGFAWALWIASLALASDWPCERDREQLELVGRILAPALVRPGRTDFDLELERSVGSAHWPGRVRLSWYEPTATPRAGERWRLGARLRCRRGFVNPGAPDRERSLLRERIGATGYVAGEPPPHRLAARPVHPVERLRGRVSDAISGSLPAGASAAVLQGLSVGLRGNIPDRLWDALGVTGVAHLVAISGLHVTGCAVIVLLHSSRCASKSHSRALRSSASPRRTRSFPARQCRHCARFRWSPYSPRCASCAARCRCTGSSRSQRSCLWRPTRWP